MKKHIHIVTGGQRSGKSSYAEKLALELSPSPIYIATSRIWDDEHRKRIEKHKENRRNQAWINKEEEKFLSKVDVNNQVVLIDCVTLWATNFFYDLDSNVDESLKALKEEFKLFTNQNAHFIFVTNEIGMGEMSMNAVQRKFADLQGWFNQHIANEADNVTFMVSGIPLTIKE